MHQPVSAPHIEPPWVHAQQTLRQNTESFSKVYEQRQRQREVNSKLCTNRDIRNLYTVWGLHVRCTGMAWKSTHEDDTPSEEMVMIYYLQAIMSQSLS